VIRCPVTMMLLWIDLDAPWCIYVHRDIFPRIDYVQRPLLNPLGSIFVHPVQSTSLCQVLLEDGNGDNTPSLFK
jgi:hypothetical protein